MGFTVDIPEEMIGRSNLRSNSKLEDVQILQRDSNTAGDVFLAPKGGQGQRKHGVSAPSESSRELGVSGGDNNLSGSVSASTEKSPNVASNGKPILKLDDEAFKPFGSRSRACSEAGSDASFCRGGPGKASCGEPVRHSDDGVQCEKCEHWFHIACQEVPKAAYEALKKYKMLSWFCVECRDTGKSAGKDNLKVLESLEIKVDQLDKHVKDHLGKMVQCLREQERSVDTQTKLIERSIRENGTQKETYAEMVKGTCSKVVDQVSAKLSAFPQLASAQAASKDVQNISRVFDNFLDKDKRTNNLVIHNLPESVGESMAERSEHDVRQFVKLVKDVFKLQVRISRSFRGGKASPDRHRLLIVVLESVEVKQDLLKLAPQLRTSSVWGRIYISPDLTKTEREAARQLREELRARREQKRKIYTSVREGLCYPPPAGELAQPPVGSVQQGLGNLMVKALPLSTVRVFQ